MTNFVQFIESNEWEGETWSFWLQLDGNEQQIDKLRGILGEIGEAGEGETEFELTGAVEPEEIVDKLVEYADDSGYAPTHQKVTGRFAFPEGLDEDGLYKGKIAGYFEGAEA